MQWKNLYDLLFLLPNRKLQLRLKTLLLLPEKQHHFPTKISQPVISDQLQYQNLHEAWTYSHSLLLYESYLLQYNIDVFHHVLPVESLQQAKMYLPSLLLLCLTLLFHLLRDERKNRVRTILFWLLQMPYIFVLLYFTTNVLS